MKLFQITFVTLFIAVWAHAKKNPMETPGLVDGDIQVSPEEFIALKEGKLTFGSIRGGRWTKGEIPYVISSNMRASGRQRIQEAINEYHARTCLRFKQRTNERYYITFQEGTGCNSPVGMVSYGNRINLEYPGCHSKGTVMHEIGHSIGLYHEQNRPDRDQYVKIHLQNINGPWAYAFKIVNSIDSLGTPYDFHSMMHYSTFAD
uniref:Metalloendopeptidase n=1 Tax=Clytia hemisphaerica TaxID=252671 RepID=A0A7M5V032_9CNID